MTSYKVNFGLNALFKIWVTTSNQGRKSACYFWPGSDVNITRYPDYYYKYDGSVDNEERMYQALDWLDLPREERLVLAFITCVRFVAERIERLLLKR